MIKKLYLSPRRRRPFWILGSRTLSSLGTFGDFMDFESVDHRVAFLKKSAFYIFFPSCCINFANAPGLPRLPTHYIHLNWSFQQVFHTITCNAFLAHKRKVFYSGHLPSYISETHKKRLLSSPRLESPFLFALDSVLSVLDTCNKSSLNY